MAFLDSRGNFHIKNNLLPKLITLIVGLFIFITGALLAGFSFSGTSACLISIGAPLFICLSSVGFIIFIIGIVLSIKCLKSTMIDKDISTSFELTHIPPFFSPDEAIRKCEQLIEDTEKGFEEVLKRYSIEQRYLIGLFVQFNEYRQQLSSERDKALNRETLKGNKVVMKEIYEVCRRISRECKTLSRDFSLLGQFFAHMGINDLEGYLSNFRNDYSALKSLIVVWKKKSDHLSGMLSCAQNELVLRKRKQELFEKKKQILSNWKTSHPELMRLSNLFKNKLDYERSKSGSVYEFIHFTGELAAMWERRDLLDEFKKSLKTPKISFSTSVDKLCRDWELKKNRLEKILEELESLTEKLFLDMFITEGESAGSSSRLFKNPQTTVPMLLERLKLLDEVSELLGINDKECLNDSWDLLLKKEISLLNDQIGFWKQLLELYETQQQPRIKVIKPAFHTCEEYIRTMQMTYESEMMLYADYIQNTLILKNAEALFSRIAGVLKPIKETELVKTEEGKKRALQLQEEVLESYYQTFNRTTPGAPGQQEEHRSVRRQISVPDREKRASKFFKRQASVPGPDREEGTVIFLNEFPFESPPKPGDYEVLAPFFLELKEYLTLEAALKNNRFTTGHLNETLNIVKAELMIFKEEISPPIAGFSESFCLYQRIVTQFLNMTGQEHPELGGLYLESGNLLKKAQELFKSISIFEVGSNVKELRRDSVMSSAMSNRDLGPLIDIELN